MKKKNMDNIDLNKENNENLEIKFNNADISELKNLKEISGNINLSDEEWQKVIEQLGNMKTVEEYIAQMKNKENENLDLSKCDIEKLGESLGKLDILEINKSDEIVKPAIAKRFSFKIFKHNKKEIDQPEQEM